MSPLQDSKAIFLQLADTDGSAGVQTIIENHDAWSHSVATVAQLNVALRTHLARACRPAPLSARIARQHSRLQSVAISLPQALPAAG